jgi:hypothetical protein
MKVSVVIAVALCASAFYGTVGAETSTWSFDADPVDQPPGHFSFGRTGSGPPGKWIVRAAAGAPSGKQVLAQLDADPTDYRFPVAVGDAPTAADARVSVKCRPLTGTVDQACGLVLRYQDENNYYVTRANALEGNVNLYYVKDGRRKQITGWRGTVTAHAWHDLGVTATGNHFVVEWDGEKIIDANDDTFARAGKVGVWTKADSVTEFDDLRLETLPGGAAPAP